MTTRQQNRRVRTSWQRGQSLVEAAVLFPLIILVALGGISIDSYIQAQAQANQAVSRAALVAARNTFDPCMTGDEPGAGGHGFQDAVNAFNGALTSPLLTGNPTSRLTITCTSETGINPQASVTTTFNPSGPAPPPTVTQPISAWGGWSSLQPGAWPGNCVTGSPADGGCFAVWRGGVVTVKYVTTLSVRWTPFWHSITISASAGEQIEPFRAHTCPSGPASGGAPAC